ncbi:MAG: UDP-N-acetylglucosamine 1-carboxyvinyltransferase [Clostridia bacterium]|nr:UDP-N-acetylglucosamine 1-carboxyvinyltransferase [Clostridia bacterium]
MSFFRVLGGVPLFGEVNISGSKNAALPIIFASLITRGTSTIENVPDIGDVRIALELVRSFGAVTEWERGTLRINTERLEYRAADPSLTGAIRASTYLLGACLSRFGICNISDSGGCAFSDRPIDLHLLACKKFGAEEREGVLASKGLKPTTVTFPKISVGATMNALILASSVSGESRIFGFAREPHVLALCDFLSSAGADIRIEKECITVRGGKLRGGKIKVAPDMIEAGSYLAAGVITNGKVTVSGVVPEELSAFLSELRNIGISVDINGDRICAQRGRVSQKGRVVAEAYPGFPTDLQPIIAPLLTIGAGGAIVDRVWQKRYGYLNSLKPFGINYKLINGGVEIFPSVLKAGECESTDLRGGMSALLCALGAEGESRVRRAEYILRGYENVETKLRSLGAEIELIQ